MIENTQSTGESFCNAVVVTQDSLRCLDNCEWTAHPQFEGVRLKTLVLPEETGGALKALIVNVRAGCELKEHIHENDWEMHEVIEGGGAATLAEEVVDYRPGVISVIPAGVDHSVRAGDDGLILLAKFF